MASGDRGWRASKSNHDAAAAAEVAGAGVVGGPYGETSGAKGDGASPLRPEPCAAPDLASSVALRRASASPSQCVAIARSSEAVGGVWRSAGSVLANTMPRTICRSRKFSWSM